MKSLALLSPPGETVVQPLPATGASNALLSKHPYTEASVSKTLM